MAIAEEDVAQVRAATDLVALVSEHVALKRQGRRWVGLCPFHAEKTPSFSVNAEEGLYYCFGCQASGDAITFARAVEHLDFVEAVERLADRAGVTIRRDDPGSAGRRDRRKRLLEALESAASWYHERLLSHPEAGRAREYLRSRGYDGETVRAFRLGWAPEGWDSLARALRLPDAILRDSGLGFVNRAGRQQDSFRARVVFPIFDTSGRPVAFGGRILPGAGEGPKYKNSPETAVYSKRRILYGLNWAKASVVETGEVVVCEGYTDVIAFARAGIPRAVATCGTALAEEHFKLLESFASRVVLAYDADSAGRAAAERFYEWESRHDLDVSVAALPAGTDPDEAARRDPEALRAAVANARPFLQFRLERQMEGADLATAEGRARAARRALGVVSEHPNELVRDQYLMVVADLCHLDPSRLRSLMGTERGRRAGGAGLAGGAERSGRPERSGAVEATSAGGDERSERVELEALRLLVHRRPEMDGLLAQSLFERPLHQGAFRALRASPSVSDAIGASEPEVAQLLGRLAVEETDADAFEVASQLAYKSGRRSLADLEAELRRSPEREIELMATTSWLRLSLEAVRGNGSDIEALGRLVAWLAEGAKEDA